MEKYILLTDSSCDLPEQIINDLDIRVLQLDVLVDGEQSKPNDAVDIKEFFEMLRSGKDARTSAVNTERFLVAFKDYLDRGYDILYLGFSSALSGTYNAGFVAAKELSEQYPDRKIITVDTLSASMGQGLIVYIAAQMRASGADIQSVRDYVEQNKLHMCHWFTVNDLFFLKRGGRVSAATAIIGSMLSIKPILHVDNDGRLINVGKARGRKASIIEMFNHMQNSVINPETQTVFISHGDCIEDAEFLADMIREKLHVKNVVISYVGSVVGAHSGPGTLALFFLGTER